MSVFSKAFAFVTSFLAAVPGSIKGHINVQEMFRVVVMALISGGGFAGVVSAISGDLPAILSNPADVSVAAAALTLVLETARRLGHGSAASPATLPFTKR